MIKPVEEPPSADVPLEDNNLWKLIEPPDQEKRPDQRGHQLTNGDVIKLGRIKLRLKHLQPQPEEENVEEETKQELIKIREISPNQYSYEQRFKHFIEMFTVRFAMEPTQPKIIQC